jgi:putative endonuclease
VTGYAYMMGNKKRGVIYSGSTVDMMNRGWEHRNKLLDGFTKRYNLIHLVWYERYGSIENARAMEQKLKNMPRHKKIEIIERDNSEWHDLYYDVAPYEPLTTQRTAVQDSPDPAQRLRRSQDL